MHPQGSSSRPWPRLQRKPGSGHGGQASKETTGYCVLLKCSAEMGQVGLVIEGFWSAKFGLLTVYL